MQWCCYWDLLLGTTPFSSASSGLSHLSVARSSPHLDLCELCSCASAWLVVGGGPQTAFPAANGGAAGTVGGQGRCVGEHGGTGPLEKRRVTLELAPTGTSLVGLREHQESLESILLLSRK